MLLKKSLPAILILIFSFGFSYGQVNIQTGSAVYSIPLFNWQDKFSRLNSNITLSYNSGNGLNVNSMASKVGEGWSLLEGGYIVRLQNEHPDDQKPLDALDRDLNGYPAGFLYNTKYGREGCPNEIIKYPLFRTENYRYRDRNPVIADRELDQFAFNFNGRNGVFILPKNNGNEAITLGYSKLKITYTKNEGLATSLKNRTTINGFEITDEAGLIYRFTEIEQTKVLRKEYTNKEGLLSAAYNNRDRIFYENSFDAEREEYVVSGWYLKEVEDMQTQRKIIFNYHKRNLDVLKNIAVSYDVVGRYSLISKTSGKSKSPDISSIIFPDGHKAEFNYNSAERTDMKGAFALSSVDILYENEFLSKYVFNTSYFILNRIGSPTSDYQKRNARLCLRSIQKFTSRLGGVERPYVFDYYMGSNVEDDIVPGPFSVFKDNWGYYNGNNTRDYNNNLIPINKDLYAFTKDELLGICYLRKSIVEPIGGPTNWLNVTPIINPKSGYAKNGLLRKITIPSKGTLSYEYDQNKTVVNGVEENVGGVHVIRTLETDGGYSNDCSNPLVTNYKFIKEDGKSSLWGDFNFDNRVVYKSNYRPLGKYFMVKINPPSIRMKCDFYNKHPGLLDRKTFIPPPRDLMMRSFSSLSANSNDYQYFDVNTINTVRYNSELMTGSGDWGGHFIAEAVLSVLNVLFTCFKTHESSSTNVVYHNSNVGEGQLLPSQFNRLEKSQGSINQNGKTVISLTSSDDYAIWEPSNTAKANKQRFAPWAYGLIKEKKVYDVNNNLVSEKINSYEYLNAKFPISSVEGEVAFPDAWSCKCDVKESYSEREDLFFDPMIYNANYKTSSTADLSVDIYDAYTGRVELTSTKERIYNAEGNFKETSTSFMYNSYYQPMGVDITEPNGDIISKTIRYSHEIPNMNNAGIFNEFIGSTTLVKKSGAIAFKTIANERVDYIRVANNDLRPSKRYETRYSEPHSGPIVPETEVEQYLYNDESLPVGIKLEGDRSSTKINGYNGRFITAIIENTHPINDKSTATSFEVNNEFGGWVLTGGTATYVTNKKVTGIRSFTLTSGKSLTTGSLNTTKAYRLSFWANSDHSLTITGSPTLIKTGPVVGELTYYEYIFPTGKSSVVISGVGVIDELRLYPQYSRMLTTTYDPLIGKTSECDENNRILYYEYDERGRLRFIKDDNRNIVKMFEYGESNKPECPVLFTNLRVSEYYIKNNCAPGYIGSMVEYVIPSETFTSTISQEVVDVLVDEDLAKNGQNYANTNGTCTQLFLSEEMSKEVSKNDCELQYFVGTLVSYVVPYGRYTSVISQEDADEKALLDLNANAQLYANNSGFSICVVNTEADWIGTGAEQCIGNRKHALVRDMNPNSLTYSQTQWIDLGEDVSCGGTPCPKYKITVPDNIATNLYVAYTPCGSGQMTVVAFSSLTGEHNDDETEKDFEICSETFPEFRYGALGDNEESLPLQVWEEAGGCDIPPPTVSCPKYKITLDFSTFYFDNIYVKFKLCGEPQSVVSLLMLDYELSAEPGKIQITICSEIPPQFRYGANGYEEVMMDVQVTNLGVPCGDEETPPVGGCQTCYDENQKCINSICETGYKVYTSSYVDGNGQGVCVYHYEFSDGSWSQDYYEYNSMGFLCPVMSID